MIERVPERPSSRATLLPKVSSTESLLVLRRVVVPRADLLPDLVAPSAGMVNFGS